MGKEEQEMKIINKLSRLSKLYLSDAEKASFSKDITKMISFVDKINELDTKDVEPTAHTLSLSNVYREDIVKNSTTSVESIIDLAPEHENNLIKVPKVI